MREKREREREREKERDREEVGGGTQGGRESDLDIHKNPYITQRHACAIEFLSSHTNNHTRTQHTHAHPPTPTHTHTTRKHIPADHPLFAHKPLTLNHKSSIFAES